MDKKEKVIVIGYGWVGQANALSFLGLGYPIGYFDPSSDITLHYKEKYASWYESIIRLGAPLEHDSEETVYLVCVGDRVSEEGEQDISLIKGALDSLKKAKGTIILRSTVLPERLKELSFDFYVPEFLHEKKAVEECSEPYFTVIGKRGSREEPTFFKIWREKARKTFVGSPEEASYIKYLSNIWNATRIAFVNEFGGTITSPSNKEHVASIEKIMDFLFDGRSYLRYGRSFGGHCLPKDTRAFMKWYEKKGQSLPLISGAYKSNMLHKEIEKTYTSLKEWFSEWPSKHIGGRFAIKELVYSVKKNLNKFN